MQRLTPRQRSYVNTLRARAWKAGLLEVTFSQIAKDIDGWEERIRKAENPPATPKNNT